MSYLVPSTATAVDWEKIGKPDKIYLSGKAPYPKPLYFKNLYDCEVTNLDGPVNLKPFKMDNCRYVRFGGNQLDEIKLSDLITTPRTEAQDGGMGVQIYGRSSDIEISWMEIFDVGFAGIMAKDDGAKRGEFTMENIYIHDVIIHHTRYGEGLYIGDSFWHEGKKHEMRNVTICRVQTYLTALEGIQVGSCPIGAKVYDNLVYGAGLRVSDHQRNGIQLGAGTGGKCYGNKVRGTGGNGIICLGTMDNEIYNNDLQGCAESGIFVDSRGIPKGDGVRIMGNTITSPGVDGIRMYALEGLFHNVTYNTITNPKGAFVYLKPGVAGRFEPNFVSRGL